jgi:rare lipoprotein A
MRISGRAGFRVRLSLFQVVNMRVYGEPRRPAAPYVLLLLLLASLSGCATPHEERKEPAPSPPQAAEFAPVIPPEPAKLEQPPLVSLSRRTGRTGRPYQVYGKTYRPLLTATGYEEKGIASWYGPSFHGRHTSCGEVFDMYRLSAAHKLLPMHTRISVTNLENGKSITLCVNDRGPFVPGRVLDLSYAAAKTLAFADKGLARILIRTSGPVEGQRANDLTGAFFVHVGSFELEANARFLLEDMKSMGYRASLLKVIRIDRDEESRWRVEVGPYKSMSDADRAQSKVVKDYPSAFTMAKE